MTTYICNECHRAFHGPSCPKSRKIRPLITCPGCGCHRARKATRMEAQIVDYLMKSRKVAYA